MRSKILFRSLLLVLTVKILVESASLNLDAAVGALAEIQNDDEDFFSGVGIGSGDFKSDSAPYLPTEKVETPQPTTAVATPTTTTPTPTPPAGHPEPPKCLKADPFEPQIDPESMATALILENAATIQTARYQLCRQKIQMAFNFLSDILPALQSVHRDMSDLLLSSADPELFGLEDLKQMDEDLEKELEEVVDRMKKNKREIQEYSRVYGKAEAELNSVEETMASIMSERERK